MNKGCIHVFTVNRRAKISTADNPEICEGRTDATGK